MKMTETLTKGQGEILRALLFQEARRLGFGTQYTERNRDEWPKRLRDLQMIILKLKRGVTINWSERR